VEVEVGVVVDGLGFKLGFGSGLGFGLGWGLNLTMILAARHDRHFPRE
jgi:hypothetical protein